MKTTMLQLAFLSILAAGTARATYTSLTGGAVTIANFTFGPGAIRVPAGARVVWTNQDDIPHTVVDSATQRSFKSAPLDSNESFSYVFTKPGTYHYFCSLHPRMQGTVVVQ